MTNKEFIKEAKLNMAIGELRSCGYNGPLLVETIVNPDAELRFGSYRTGHASLSVPAWVLREMPEGTFLGSDRDDDFDDITNIELYVCAREEEYSIVIERRYDLQYNNSWEQTSAAVYVLGDRGFEL